jgi:hypothetical protein
MSQELSTAKYYEQSQAQEPPRESRPAPRDARSQPEPAPRSTGRMEGLARCATPVIAGLLLAGSGAAIWLNRTELAGDAAYVDERTNPLNFMLWLGGSDKTMKDVVLQAQQNATHSWTSELGSSSALEAMDLGNVDWSNFSQGVNPGIAVGPGGKSPPRKASSGGPR